MSPFNTNERRKGWPQMKSKRAALYVRVSSGEQHTEAQERALREYVQRRGWVPHKIYRDKGISGATASRPGLDELLKACRRKAIDVVVVWKFDRFARSLKNLIAGGYSGTSILSTYARAIDEYRRGANSQAGKPPKRSCIRAGTTEVAKRLRPVAQRPLQLHYSRHFFGISAGVFPLIR